MENRIKSHAKKFRLALEKAKSTDEFRKDILFRNFPTGCCGDTCYLLGQYLLHKGIRTKYVCGTYYGDGSENIQSHAWLMTDNRVIIDITGDQFKYHTHLLCNNRPVYVGEMDDFYSLFEVEERDIRDTCNISQLGGFSIPRLRRLYNIICAYID